VTLKIDRMMKHVNWNIVRSMHATVCDCGLNLCMVNQTKFGMWYMDKPILAREVCVFPLLTE